MKRNKHSLSHHVLSTFDMGELVPVANYEVLPGDSVRHSTSCLIRVSPLMAPVMHSVSVRLHHWYVPYRLLWDDFEEFITGGPLNTFSTPPPRYNLGDIANARLPNRMGIYGVAGSTIPINAFAFRAYNKIWNEFYRDQDLQNEVDVDDVNVLRVAWEKDYLTAARPWPQKGPTLTLPIAGRIPIKGLGVAAGAPTTAGGVAGNSHVTDESGVTLFAQQWLGSTANHVRIEEDPSNPGFPNVYGDASDIEGVDIREVRELFALQRYAEARAQFGSRYTEYLRYLGVRSSDARLQRPEYLGGGKATISFSEVLKTGEGDTPSDEAPIGEMRGHGISAMRSRTFTRFFEEHGVVLTLASLRPRSMYTQGIYRGWSRASKEDFWQKELEQVGQQTVRNKEVYAPHATPDGTFGYQDRYAEYRHLPSYVCGDFRTTMNDWHLARDFGSTPALNSDFIQCVPSKRIHAEQTTDTIWGMFAHSIQARRMVGHKTIGRLF